MASEADWVFREKLGHVEFEWEIPNILSHLTDDRFDSPTFFMGDAKWCLRICPKHATSSGLCISLNLRRTHGAGEHRISYSYTINAGESIINEINNQIETFTPRTIFSQARYIQRVALSNLKQNESWDRAITVVFSARLLDDRNQDTATQTSRPEGVENLSTNWEELFLNGRHTDVKLKVKGREFNAHKLVLGTRSPVFNAMFNYEMAENNSGVVEIPDLDPESFQDFLSFVYTGKFDILTPRNALDLYKAADKYDLKDIKKECALRMVSWMTIGNIFDVIVLAATHEETELLKHATEYFIANAKEIFLTGNWKTFFDEQTPLANDLLIKMANKL